MENAFKYTGGAYTLDIRLTITGKHIQFSVENSLGTGQRVGPGGIGLTNLRRRLELLYPGRHRFQSVAVSETRWQALLSIDLS